MELFELNVGLTKKRKSRSPSVRLVEDLEETQKEKEVRSHRLNN